MKAEVISLKEAEKYSTMTIDEIEKLIADFENDRILDFELVTDEEKARLFAPSFPDVPQAEIIRFEKAAEKREMTKSEAFSEMLDLWLAQA